MYRHKDSLWNGLAACAAILAMVVAVTASAQEEEEEKTVQPQGMTFTQGSWNLDLYAGAVTGSHDVTYTFGAVAYEYFLWDDVALTSELLAYSASQRGSDAEGAGFNLMTRWYCPEHEGPWAFYAEIGVGLAQFNNNTPRPYGTHFNYTWQAGAGAKYRLQDQLYLTGGARFMHLSNAGKHGQGRNPGFNGLGGYLGLTILF